MVSLSSFATEAECADRVWRCTRLRIDVVVGVRQARLRDWLLLERKARDEREKYFNDIEEGGRS